MNAFLSFLDLSNSHVLQEYNTAVQTEDFREAARLRDEAAISLRGWWHMQSSSAENPGHLLRIRQAFDRYVLLAYSPQDIANIHVSPHSPVPLLVRLVAQMSKRG